MNAEVKPGEADPADDDGSASHRHGPSLPRRVVSPAKKHQKKVKRRCDERMPARVGVAADFDEMRNHGRSLARQEVFHGKRPRSSSQATKCEISRPTTVAVQPKKNHADDAEQGDDGRRS